MSTLGVNALAMGVSVKSRSSLTGEAAYWANLSTADRSRVASYNVVRFGGKREDLIRNLLAVYKQAFHHNRREHAGISDKNVHHLAMVEVIMANRPAFPPGRFNIRTELEDGASITTPIPALGESGVRVEIGMSLTLAELQAEIILDVPGRTRQEPPAWGRDKKVEAPSLEESAFAFSQVQGAAR